jgi:hypothetical protein
LSTTNPTCTDPGSNPGLRGERPATKGLNHGTAVVLVNSGGDNLNACTKELEQYEIVE